MRLIDADLIEELLGCEDEDIYCKETIREAQTIEAVPVVQGEWIKTFKSMVQNLNTGKSEPKYSCDCSICKWHTGNQGTRFNFCPNCGADMRKKV